MSKGIEKVINRMDSIESTIDSMFSKMEKQFNFLRWYIIGWFLFISLLVITLKLL